MPSLFRHRERNSAMTTPPPVPPKITGITYSPNPAAAGQKVLATIGYIPGSSVAAFEGTGTVKAAASGLTGTMTAAFEVQMPDPTSADGFADTGGHTWALVSDSGGVAVYSTTA